MWLVSLCRSLYQILSFIFFFFNVIYGIVMCFLRVFAMVIFTIVMLFRIDRDVYMRGLEGWDVGTWTSLRLYIRRNNIPVSAMKLCVSLMCTLARSRLFILSRLCN